MNTVSSCLGNPTFRVVNHSGLVVGAPCFWGVSNVGTGLAPVFADRPAALPSRHLNRKPIGPPRHLQQSNACRHEAAD